MAFQFSCWHCNAPQIVTPDNFHAHSEAILVGEHSSGRTALGTWAVRCLNKDCNKLNLKVTHGAYTPGANGPVLKRDGVLQDWRLLPESSAVQQPAFIPEPLVQDYYEACRIADLSPKASATLARRCLQGMIRDFCGIAKSTLAKEIETLAEALAADQAPRSVSAESIEALDAIRKVGNIGAHMEKDINLIIDVDPGEARVLLNVIEQLFVDWYGEREARARRFAAAKALAVSKTTP